MTLANIESKLATYLTTKASDESFPDRDADYSERFARIDEYLNKNIHPTINVGAAAAAKNDDGWLTDHGPDHIVTVIRRACDMVFRPDSGQCVLKPYECYLLLLSIHFHDVGNIFGRDEHEKKITEVMTKIGSDVLGHNSLEKRLIRDVATAHGGYANGSKDTIGQLKYEQSRTTTGPRVHLLAGILRLADELADDHTRTKRFLVEPSNSADLLLGSQIYHHYADRLREVKPDLRDGLIRLRFELDIHKDRQLIVNKCKRGQKTKFLFDEILDRVLKMHRERVYCNKYTQPEVFFEAVEAQILICSDDYMTVLDKIEFSVRDNAYPTDRKLSAICPEIEGKTGNSLRKIVMNYNKTGEITR